MYYLYIPVLALLFTLLRALSLQTLNRF